MIKKVLVAGCRNYNNYAEAKKFIDNAIIRIKNKYTLVFVSGTCRGADLLGEKYAIENGFEVERYPADWDRYGKSAGPKRNETMARISDFVICFWDGESKGTKSLINYVNKLNKPLRIKYISCKSSDHMLQ